METWKHYLGATVPRCKPHETPNTALLCEPNIWKKGPFKGAFFARWTTDFDTYGCNEWYWCIKDTPFDLQSVKAKIRYEIKKGISLFTVKVINPSDHFEELYETTVDSLSSYPKRYRNIPSRKEFEKRIRTWKEPCFAAFFNETGQLCGYINMVENGKAVHYVALCVRKAFEKQAINAALVYGMLEHYRERLEHNTCYIVDGERNINHITNHQNYLMQKFGFRKAPCQLHLRYRPGLAPVIATCYCFRKLLAKCDRFGRLIHKLNGLLAMEEVVRIQKEKTKKK